MKHAPRVIAWLKAALKYINYAHLANEGPDSAGETASWLLPEGGCCGPFRDQSLAVRKEGRGDQRSEGAKAL